MNWLDFTTTLVNANVGITNDNLEIYEDEIFNSILANYDDNTSEPGKINVVAINKTVGK